MPTATITNISCYKFAPLDDLKTLRTELLDMANELQLKGTVLMSPEGINLFVAGIRDKVDTLVERIRAVPGLDDLAPKYSESEEQPFRRMLVRLKKEIIAFGVEGVNPALRTSPKLKAAELKQWLDEGREVLLLDTRNDYEVKLGTFKNALPISVDHFRDFPAAVRNLPSDLKDRPIVMFCTGGIRCEKAGPFMEMEGFKHIYQLDGGILKYFEEVGGHHYDGECFVFDQRVGVDAALHETESNQCFVCQSPLTKAEQRDPRYEVNASCPYCFKPTEEHDADALVKAQAALNGVMHPLPGSIPYDNYKPLCCPLECDHFTLIDMLCHVLPHVERGYWMSEIEKGYLVDDNRQPCPAGQVLRAGQRVYHRFPDNTEPPINPGIRLLHLDEAILVVDKPAPLPMHPSGRFHRNTLQWVLNEVFHPQKPRPIHRLDADTTGVVLFARTAHFAKRLQPQFLKGSVEKTYLLRVQGHPQVDHFICTAPIAETDQKGRCIDDDEGQTAETHFRVLRRDEDGTALLEAKPKTGRTNQIRLHANHLGFPIVGDGVYQADSSGNPVTTKGLADEPLCLHSRSLSIVHPTTGKPMVFETPAPAWS